MHAVVTYYAVSTMQITKDERPGTCSTTLNRREGNAFLLIEKQMTLYQADLS
jgi:hypothetical protein